MLMQVIHLQHSGNVFTDIEDICGQPVPDPDTEAEYIRTMSRHQRHETEVGRSR